MSEDGNQVQTTGEGATPVTPSELRGAAADLAAGIPKDQAPSTEAKIPSGSPHAGGDAQDFACHIHSYLRQYIEFSDKKATFVFAIDAALLIYMYQADLQLRWLKDPRIWLASDFFIFLAMALLLVGAIACAFVIIPRFINSHRGFVYFGSIIEFESASDYSNTIFKQAKLDLTDALLKHNYDLAKICKAKYTKLAMGVWLSLLGIILAIGILILSSPIQASK